MDTSFKMWTNQCPFLYNSFFCCLRRCWWRYYRYFQLWPWVWWDSREMCWSRIWRNCGNIVWVRVRGHCHCWRWEPRFSVVSCTLWVRGSHMAIQRPDGDPWRLLDTVWSEWCLWSFWRGTGVVTVLKVRAGFIHRRKAWAEMCGGLQHLSRGLFPGRSLEEFLKLGIVLSGLGEQGWRVVLGKWARPGNSATGKSHECIHTLWT